MAVTPISWHLEGAADTEYVAGILKVGAQRAKDTRVVMERITADMMRVEAKTFESQGRRGGGSWKRLASDTVRKKGDSQILRTDGARPGYSSLEPDALFRSLTVPDAPYQILNVTRNSIRFGTDRPYAEVQQRGSWIRSIPARPFLRFLPTDMNRWRTMMIEFLMEPFVKGKKGKITYDG